MSRAKRDTPLPRYYLDKKAPGMFEHSGGSWVKAADAEREIDEARRLLTEVVGNFTRDDDLPDRLLDRIDDFLERHQPKVTA